MSDDWIQTASGKAFHFMNVREDDICILDIAHALAHTCRFGGHCQAFYSVAQHSCLMCAAMGAEGASIEAKRWALMHDCDEAYLPDVPRPVKKYLYVSVSGRDGEFLPYNAFARQITNVVARKFGLLEGGENMPEIKLADMRMLATEKRDLMGEIFPLKRQAWDSLEGVIPYTENIMPWRPEIARQMFLDNFRVLFRGHPVPQSMQSIGKAAGTRREKRL